MSALLNLPRIWWLAIMVPVVAASVGLAVVFTSNSSPASKVLGEKVTGSGTSGSNGAGNPNGKPNDGASPGHAFMISGEVDGLFPGGEGKLYLTVTNPNSQAITVTSLSASLRSVSGAPDCSATSANLTISPYTGPSFDVNKNSSKLSLGYIPVTLPMTADNNCQGAVYNLAYSGTAVQK